MENQKLQIDKINKRIIQNMIEILNMQIILKLSSNLNKNNKKFMLHDMSPIELKVFNQLIP